LGERLDGQPRLFDEVNQVEKERVRRNGSRFETFVHVQMASQLEFGNKYFGRSMGAR
jgi:hypothetical protein